GQTLDDIIITGANGARQIPLVGGHYSLATGGREVSNGLRAAGELQVDQLGRIIVNDESGTFLNRGIVNPPGLRGSAAVSELSEAQMEIIKQRAVVEASRAVERIFSNTPELSSTMFLN